MSKKNINYYNMSYINPIDSLIYESISEIYSELKNEKLLKLKSFGKDELYLKLIDKYIKSGKTPFESTKNAIIQLKGAFAVLAIYFSIITFP